MTEARYLVCGSRPWSRRAFDEVLAKLPGQWHFVASPEELTVEALRRFRPRALFFLHWSWKVPAEIHGAYECVVFHMTDVPYGRGGSPLQNLVLAGARTTKLSALRMVEELDAGPVYAKEELSLEGSAEEVFTRASFLAARMIQGFLDRWPEPVPQQGTPTRFTRRTPAQSLIPDLPTLDKLHDFLRMLDAEGYPRAYLDHAGFRYEFRDARREGERLRATVDILPLPEGSL